MEIPLKVDINGLKRRHVLAHMKCAFVFPGIPLELVWHQFAEYMYS